MGIEDLGLLLENIEEYVMEQKKVVSNILFEVGIVRLVFCPVHNKVYWEQGLNGPMLLTYLNFCLLFCGLVL